MSGETIFLDRDGVINRKAAEGDYIKTWSEFEFLPGVKHALRHLSRNGYRLIVVTNQRGISLGRMSTQDVEDIHRRMRAELKKAGANIAAIYYCPHDIGTCDCRKPAVGMLVRARTEYPAIDFRASFVVGDDGKDIEAGQAIDATTILVGQAGGVRATGVNAVVPDHFASSLLDAVHQGLFPPAPHSLPPPNTSAHLSRPHLLIAHSLIGRGGDAVQMGRLERNLKLHGYRVSSVGLQSPRPYATSGRSNTLRTWGRSRPVWQQDLASVSIELISTGLAIVRILADRPDVIMVRQSSYGIMASVLTLFSRVPMILEVDANLEAERHYGRAGFGPVSRTLLRRALHSARCVLVHARPVAHWLEAQDVEAARITTYLNPPPDELFSIPERAERARRSPLVVGYAGSMAPWHRVDLLIRAAAEIRQQATPGTIQVVLVGDGRDGAEVRSLINQLELTDMVSWCGAVTEREVWAQMASWDIGVLPWTLNSGCPMKLLEYAAAGLAIVAPSLANVTELLTPADEMALLDRPDASALASVLLNLAQDPGRRMALAHSARVRAREYSIEHQMTSCLADWKRLGLPVPNPGPIPSSSQE